ncbi:hypothetical protein ACJJIP_16345 [Microbulbifer sp. VTAC004]|uniref:hypothetical protein n=1 Tax=unclassified Microbulbifer TaxID=2619833 RepID=UPI0040393055
MVVKSDGGMYAALDQAAADIVSVLQDDATLGKTCDLFLLSQTQNVTKQNFPAAMMAALISQWLACWISTPVKSCAVLLR